MRSPVVVARLDGFCWQLNKWLLYSATTLFFSCECTEKAHKMKIYILCFNERINFRSVVAPVHLSWCEGISWWDLRVVRLNASSMYVLCTYTQLQQSNLTLCYILYIYIFILYKLIDNLSIVINIYFMYTLMPAKMSMLHQPHTFWYMNIILVLNISLLRKATWAFVLWVCVISWCHIFILEEEGR